MTISNVPLPPETAEQYQERFLSQAVKLLPEVVGWTVYAEMDGSWCWESQDGRTVYATPFWDGMPGVPVEMAEEFTYASCIVPFALSGNLEEDAKRYVELVKPYLLVSRSQTGVV